MDAGTLPGGAECLVYTPGYCCRAINLVAGTANYASLFYNQVAAHCALVKAGMSDSLLRLKQMLLGQGTVRVIYSFSDYLQGEGYQLTPLIIDNQTSFSPLAVQLYLSFFFTVPLGCLSTPFCHLRWLVRSTQISVLVAGVFYLLRPTTMHYPSFDQMGISAGALNRPIVIDSGQNCFPSLHAALTLLAVWAIVKKGSRQLTLMSIVWATAVAFSILQLRRYLFIDLVGGALLAPICGWICVTCEKRKTQYE